MLTSSLLQPLEKALNGYLALDPESAQGLEALEGRTLCLQFFPFRLNFQLHFEGKRLRLLTASEQKTPEVTLKGTPLSLLSLALSRNKKKGFSTEDLSLEGDAELAQQVTELFSAMDIDWEEYLSRLLGDVPAHELSRFTKGILAFGKEAKERLFENTKDYVHEEKPFFPPAEALEDFFKDVDDLRLDLDRLEARIKSL